MTVLSSYGERVIDRISMLGMWLAVTICIRNFFVCLRQYRSTHGFIHLMNMTQVVVLCIHRFVYGLVPLFEITTCAFWPLLVSLWHLTYLLFYAIMFKRLIILESEKHSIWIKIIGVCLITLRLADWPYELAFHSLQQQIMHQTVVSGSNCHAQWGTGVIILNFVADALNNLFLSGMFVRRLYVHMQSSSNIMSHRNRVIEYVARKSLICFILTFVVNLIMNLLKVTQIFGNRSDALTAYFEIVESTLLVEALKMDYLRLPNQLFCENCGLIINSYGERKHSHPLYQQQINDQLNTITLDIPITSTTTTTTTTATSPQGTTSNAHPVERVHRCITTNTTTTLPPHVPSSPTSRNIPSFVNQRFSSAAATANSSVNHNNHMKSTTLDERHPLTPLSMEEEMA
ncbi:hypothetical protein BDF20DRAFT_864400 [Mycotypha africana]|uniref:uncharacterized protein n=1 Tax=Mycotypha africana TaxID=64632 RepID=UPI0023018667|nr:uncharacterized protein BDF20DRAFT_864400 [Mycotypha africana]KAI8981983.1 hypothetical protein BDF20DRAFT_864400 [Mycotypha africana]